MTTSESFELEGGCTCRSVRYRMTDKPMFVHCCHCSWCQRETGSAFVLNALIEGSRVKLLSGQPVVIDTLSHSGRGQKIVRCPHCHVAVWSHYAVSGDKINFIRVGTLDDSRRISPDIHIYTSTKHPWVVLPAGVRAVPEFYDPKTTWPEETMKRFMATRS
jgi:hypothetical protein